MMFGNNNVINEKGFQEDVAEVNENVLLGLLGAFIGSVVGAALIILLGWLGFIASYSGVLMAIGALMGYKAFAKKLSIKGIVISVVVMIVMTYLAERIVWSISLYKELVQEYDNVSLLAIFQNLNPILAEFELAGEFMKDLMMLYIFTAVGAFPTIKKNYKAGKATKISADDSANAA